MPDNKKTWKLFIFPPSVNWSDKTILIFERDYSSASLLIELLRSTGVKIIHIRKKSEMLSFYDPSVDLIICGIDRTEMNTGLRIARITRSRFMGKPILAHSVCVSVYARRACLEAGCDGFVGKPLELDDFVALVTKYMELEKWCREIGNREKGR